MASFSDKRLLWLSIFLALAGTIAFAFLAARLSPTPLPPSEVTVGHAGLLAQVSGRPTRFSNRSGLSFFLCDGQCLQVSASPQLARMLEESGAAYKLGRGASVVAVGIVRASPGGPVLQLLDANSLAFVE